MSLPPSPFLSKLRTDFFASPAEEVEIHHLISTRRDRLQAIEDEIARLRAEQLELQTFVDEHLSLISPIRKVPIDVLREIFLQSMPENGFPACRALEAPLVFTGVCRLWREGAISIPMLWNRIHIHLPAPTPDGQPITEKFLTFLHLWREGVMTWLGRSGTVPLVVSLRGGLDWCSAQERVIEFHADVVLQLLECTSRWRSLSLNVSVETWRIVAMSKAELPLLETLAAPFPTTGLVTEEEHENLLKAVVKRAPSLRKLYLGPLPDNLPIRWDRLTEVSLQPSGWPRELRMSQAIQVLYFSCTSLRHFTANIQIETSGQPAFSPITLPSLQTLNIGVMHVRYHHPIDDPEPVFRRFLDCIEAPNLVSFSLNCTKFHRRISSLTSLVGFLKRSGCALRSLVLSVPVPSTEMNDLLVSMPSLVQLKLTPVLEPTPWLAGSNSDWHLPGMLIDLLTPSQSNIDCNVLCPNLEFLVVRGCPALYALPIIALAEARCAEQSSTQKLKRLQVQFRYSIEDTEVPLRVEALRRRGMLVKVDSAENPNANLVTTRPKPDFCDYVHSGQLWWPIDDV
ncbi:hypothetical protein VNI00_008552 [Paramarasmius palmivorus]|uniref:F-box domain-containing protein n=1 Tax=Paramarasmius palmivorus TaxID=297713 RepID=A0AAW0CXA4_9AGAR